MQLINDYSKICKQYKDREILVTDAVIKIVRLVPKNIILKCGPYHFPITLHSISSNKSVVILQVSDLATDVFAKYSGNVEIRFYSKGGGDKPCFFFIAGKALLPTAHPDIEMFSFLPILFNDSCPHLLIDLFIPLFNILDSVKKRLDHRIFIPFGKANLYHIDQNHCYIACNNHLHLAVVSDISLLGIHLIVLADQLISESIIDFHLATTNTNRAITLKCEVVKSSRIKSSKELLSLSIRYIAGEIPDAYRIFFKKALEADIIRRNG